MGGDTEQEILEGIEKFQQMLSRYPLRPKSSKASMVNKNLNRVYGKIKQNFNRNILNEDLNEIRMQIRSFKDPR